MKGGPSCKASRLSDFGMMLGGSEESRVISMNPQQGHLPNTFQAAPRSSHVEQLRYRSAMLDVGTNKKGRNAWAGASHGLTDNPQPCWPHPAKGKWILAKASNPIAMAKASNPMAMASNL